MKNQAYKHVLYIAVFEILYRGIFKLRYEDIEGYKHHEGG
jgi:hypothetical protein